MLLSLIPPSALKTLNLSEGRNWMYLPQTLSRAFWAFIPQLISSSASGTSSQEAAAPHLHPHPRLAEGTRTQSHAAGVVSGLLN